MLIVLLLTSSVFSSHCFAADAWTLTTSDFQSSLVQLQGLDAQGLAILTVPAMTPQTVPLTRLLSLDRATAVRPQPARFVIRKNNGDQIAGDPASMTEDALLWHSGLLGDLTIPLKSAVSILRSNGVEKRSDAPRTEDAVTLANGDAAKGVVSSLNATTVSVQPSAGGDATSMPLDSVTEVDFASTGGATTAATASSPSTAFRVRLADSSLITARDIHADNWTLHIVLTDGSEHDVPMQSVSAIEQVNGPVLWLSSLTPTENIQTPLLDAHRPARFDRSINGGPILFGDRMYAHGIGVHAYSRLSWNLDPSEKSFRTQYAIDGDAPYADVTVRIKLDGQTLHEQKDLRAGVLSPIIQLDVTGKSTITLEVDYGSNGDVQARVNWIEPGVIANRIRDSAVKMLIFIGRDVSEKRGR